MFWTFYLFMGVWHTFLFSQTSNSQMLMNIYLPHFPQNLHCENHLVIWNRAVHGLLVCVRLLLHHGQCYYPENCPCAWLGLEYLPGETVETPCYKWFAPSPVFYMSSCAIGRICCEITNSLIFIILSLLSSVCHRGYFNCTYSPCPAVCTVYSDRHYHTFDGLEYDYHTDCQVYLLKVSSWGLFLLGKVKTQYWFIFFNILEIIGMDKVK